MSEVVPFGTLADVELRSAWEHEAHAFTPWLAENLDRLGDAIGVELELTQREQGVGRFSADIVARSVMDDQVVLIENQLDWSDHKHLGQIMTYLAGTEARIVVWVAASFHDEHLSAIRWLNQHSHEEFLFFAVRLRVVRIGDSPFAPLFEVLEKPNAWERTIQQAVRQETDRGAQRRMFWARYAELYPEILQDLSRAGGANRWHIHSRSGLIVSRYKAQGNVGIFLRGPQRMDYDELAELLAPYAAELERCLGVRPGKWSSYHTEGPTLTDDPATWDQAIHWLEKQTRIYCGIIDKAVPEDLT